MEDFFNALLHCLGTINPVYAVIATIVYVLFGDRLKGLLNLLRDRLPKLPGPTPEPDPESPLDELEEWFDKHPLLDRLWERLKDKFRAVADGEADENEAYLKLLQAIKDTDVKSE